MNHKLVFGNCLLMVTLLSHLIRWAQLNQLNNCGGQLNQCAGQIRTKRNKIISVCWKHTFWYCPPHRVKQHTTASLISRLFLFLCPTGCPFWHLRALLMETILPRSNLNLPRHNLRPFPSILSLAAWEERWQPPSYNLLLGHCREK